LTLSYTNFIVLRIYAEALDRLRVRLNMYLVIIKIVLKIQNKNTKTKKPLKTPS